MDIPDAPEGWALKSLLEIDEGQWSAQLWAPNAYVYGYGSSARYAVLDALRRIEEGDYFDRLSGFTKHKIDIEPLLKLIKDGTIESIHPAAELGDSNVASGNRDSKRRF